MDNANLEKRKKEFKANQANVALYVKNLENANIALQKELEKWKKRNNNLLARISQLKKTKGETRFIKRIDDAQKYINRLKAEKKLLEEDNKRLEKLSFIDSLTGIPNRRFFQEEAPLKLADARRRREQMSLIMLDVDYFKKYNDRYGHQQGDNVLALIAQTIKRTLRETDFVTRYGGEEFVIILTDTNATGAKEAAEKAKMAIEELRIPHLDSKNSEFVTISLGTATSSSSSRKLQSIANLVKIADENLYFAKNSGRNCVCCD